MPTVVLATFSLLPDGEPGGDLLVRALAERGVDARWACWDDPAVDWARADLVAARSTWDYHRRLPEFLAWARRVEESTPLLNGAEVFAWNADKAYLLELAGTDAVAPVVPTALLDDRTLATGLGDALARWGTVVVKPRVGAGGVGLVVAASVRDERLEGLVRGPWVVQPLVESVRTSGETSVFVLEGRAVAQVDKAVAGEEVRVHESYGGSSRAVPLDRARAALAEDVVRRVAAGASGREADLAYARVDLMRWQDAWVVSELELIEPGLYLDVAPDNAGRFADLVVARLDG
ncbi:ATP-grasp domain-containing protein [Nocardioides sp. SYSU DS0651]|uniref:ATP-grasp domain-containing protein n=1 Tax=Nocardioides sp. SYSU DS0651 TaxID=3415955 RepID=UPI003F4B5534